MSFTDLLLGAEVEEPYGTMAWGTNYKHSFPRESGMGTEKAVGFIFRISFISFKFSVNYHQNIKHIKIIWRI